jgi:hypothetical protein
VRPLGEDLSVIANHIDELIAGSPIPKGVEVTLRGMVESMRVSFRSFGIGLLLSVLLLYLILVAQFRSFVRPSDHPAGAAPRNHRSSVDAVADGHDIERDVPDGSRDVGRSRDVQQHSDR